MGWSMKEASLLMFKKHGRKGMEFKEGKAKNHAMDHREF
jgi:hypothetical protein